MIEKILKNKEINNFSILENNFCTLSLSDGYSITTECLVRFTGKNNEFICTTDHGHQFGLEGPFDAEKTIKKLIDNNNILEIEVNQNTGDISLFLESGVFQIICNSSGYECYQINGPNNLIIVGHGGKQNKNT